MAAPTLEIKPGDSEHAGMYAIWLAQGRPGTIERMALGWQYRAIHPDGTASQPTFVLLASAPLTDRDLDGPPGGYAAEMATVQSSLPGRRKPLTKS